MCVSTWLHTNLQTWDINRHQTETNACNCGMPLFMNAYKIWYFTVEFCIWLFCGLHKTTHFSLDVVTFLDGIFHGCGSWDVF